MIELWTINRVLRWTGFRLFIDVDCDDGPDRRPTLIGFKWVGLPGSAGWRRMLPASPVARASDCALSRHLDHLVAMRDVYVKAGRPDLAASCDDCARDIRARLLVPPGGPPCP